jgi:hypothetical protein
VVAMPIAGPSHSSRILSESNKGINIGYDILDDAELCDWDSGCRVT